MIIRHNSRLVLILQTRIPGLGSVIRFFIKLSPVRIGNDRATYVQLDFL
jgi:hypothetical protein